MLRSLPRPRAGRRSDDARAHHDHPARHRRHHLGHPGHQGPRAEDRLRPRPSSARPGPTSTATAATPATTSCAATSPRYASRPAPTAASSSRAPSTTPTRAPPSRFVRGQGTSNAVQIDHVVALSDAWQKGAQQWSRRGAPPSPTTRSTCSPSTAPPTCARATATPPPGCRRARRFRCAYVARQIAVKHRYGLWVTSRRAGRHGAGAHRLPGAGRCPGPARSRSAAGGAGRPRRRPGQTTTPKPLRSQVATDPRFGTCREANAAGYGPYRTRRRPRVRLVPGPRPRRTGLRAVTTGRARAGSGRLGP